RYIGEFATSLEMAGASLSLLLLDDELAELLDAPAASPFFAQGQVAPVESVPAADIPVERTDSSGGARVRRTGRTSALRALLVDALAELPAHAEELRALDARLGDGDLGITVSTGAKAVREALLELPEDVHAADLLRTAGVAFASASPSTFGALVGTGRLRAAAATADVDEVTAVDAARITQAVAHRVQERGGARRGDKTFLDVLLAVAEALSGAADARTAAETAVAAAERTVSETRNLASARGRAAWVGQRSVGEPDPGSVAVLRFLEALRDQTGCLLTGPPPGPTGQGPPRPQPATAGPARTRQRGRNRRARRIDPRGHRLGARDGRPPRRTGDAVGPTHAAQVAGGARALPDLRGPRHPAAVRAGHRRTAERLAGRSAARGERLLVGRGPLLQRPVPRRGADARLPPGRRRRGRRVGLLRRRVPAADRSRMGVRLPGRDERPALRPPRRDRLAP